MEKHVLKVKYNRGLLRPLKEYCAKWQGIVVKSIKEKEKNTEIKECLKGDKMDKEYKTNTNETPGLMSQEEIEALLEVVEEDDLTPVNNNNKHNDESNYEVYYNIPDAEPYFIINNIKLKNTTERRIIEIVNSINPNTIKNVELILSNSVDYVEGTDLFLLIGDRGYCIANVSITLYSLLKSILLEENIKAVETILCLSIGENGEISDKKITFENKLIKRSVE